MITNFILATALTLITFFLLITLDKSSALVNGIMRKALKFTRKSQKLTAYLLKAYIAYRRGAHIN